AVGVDQRLQAYPALAEPLDPEVLQVGAAGLQAVEQAVAVGVDQLALAGAQPGGLGGAGRGDWKVTARRPRTWGGAVAAAAGAAPSRTASTARATSSARVRVR